MSEGEEAEAVGGRGRAWEGSESDCAIRPTWLHLPGAPPHTKTVDHDDAHRQPCSRPSCSLSSSFLPCYTSLLCPLTLTLKVYNVSYFVHNHPSKGLPETTQVSYWQSCFLLHNPVLSTPVLRPNGKHRCHSALTPRPLLKCQYRHMDTAHKSLLVSSDSVPIVVLCAGTAPRQHPLSYSKSEADLLLKPPLFYVSDIVWPTTLPD